MRCAVILQTVWDTIVFPPVLFQHLSRWIRLFFSPITSFSEKITQYTDKPTILFCHPGLHLSVHSSIYSTCKVILGILCFSPGKSHGESLLSGILTSVSGEKKRSSKHSAVPKTALIFCNGLGSRLCWGSIKLFTWFHELKSREKGKNPDVLICSCFTKKSSKLCLCLRAVTVSSIGNCNGFSLKCLLRLDSKVKTDNQCWKHKDLLHLYLRTSPTITGVYSKLDPFPTVKRKAENNDSLQVLWSPLFWSAASSTSWHSCQVHTAPRSKAADRGKAAASSERAGQLHNSHPKPFPDSLRRAGTSQAPTSHDFIGSCI